MDTLLLIKILYGATSIQGVFLGLLLMRTRINQPANKLLAALLLLISFHLVLIGFDEREFFLRFPHLSRISWIIGVLYGPLTLLFVRHLLQLQLKPFWQGIAFLPFIVLFIILLPYYLQSVDEKRAYLDAFTVAQQDDFGWINQSVSLLHIVFALINLGLYLRWEQQRTEEYSSLENIQVRWLRQFLYFQLAVIVFGVAVFFARIFGITILGDWYRYHFIGVVFLFYWLSYKALTQPVLFGIIQKQKEMSSPDSEPPEKTPAKEASVNESLGNVFAAVQAALQEEQLYLKNDLTLTELAARAGHPRNLVSQAINQQTEGNFFDLVNQYRIDEFLKKCRDPENRHLSQLGIALESGFNSKASFYAIFKKKTGLTPSEYLARHQKQQAEV